MFHCLRPSIFGLSKAEYQAATMASTPPRPTRGDLTNRKNLIGGAEMLYWILFINFLTWSEVETYILDTV